ncbi:hypothetical protein [Naasia lichenicola]|uniref:PH domain-containing protein n=1 Tax=Naasia lichenicola TaxID=2565933 RepID=A0A4S4FIG6_9MICO|nr:hypothetical protein [Naasia lichenicola]THG29901.1 hypothetical protein E6C64_14740 [Naasia lichenicola]
MTIASQTPHADLLAGEGTVIRPLVSTLTRRYAVSATCLIVPPLTALYALTVSNGTWGYIVLLQVVMLAISIFLRRILARAKVVFSPHGFTETDLFGPPMVTRREEMRSILLIPVTDGNSSSSFDHLFLLDADDRVRLRMRGRFWGEEALRTVVSLYELPVTRIAETRTLTDLRGDFSRYLFWRERHPYLLALFMAVGIVALFGPVLWMIETLL